MTRDEALALVREYVKNEGLVRHMLSVEAAMRFYAEKFGEDVERLIPGCPAEILNAATVGALRPPR